MIVIYSVLDGNNYRRLETLSENEAAQYAFSLNKQGRSGECRVVSSSHEPVTHKPYLEEGGISFSKAWLDHVRLMRNKGKAGPAPE